MPEQVLKGSRLILRSSSPPRNEMALGIELGSITEINGSSENKILISSDYY